MPQLTPQTSRSQSALGAFVLIAVTAALLVAGGLWYWRGGAANDTTNTVVTSNDSQNVNSGFVALPLIDTREWLTYTNTRFSYKLGVSIFLCKRPS